MGLKKYGLVLLLFIVCIVEILAITSEDYRRRKCSTIDCKNNSTCFINKLGSAECICSNDFFGDDCGRRKCVDQNPCANDGLCEKTDKSFSCYCPIGYVGIYCQTKLPTVCDSEPCEFGSCKPTDVLGNYVCTCNYGYTGKNCSEVDHCVENKCLYGTCVNDAIGYDCQCFDGFKGADCSIPINRCKQTPNLCKNGGNCVSENQGKYHCSCPLGFTGQNCEIKHSPYECSPVNPCMNQGVCSLPELAQSTEIFLPEFLKSIVKNQENAYKCGCPPGLYNGTRCQQRLDDCSNGDVLCLNGGVCVLGMERSYCKCPPWHYGSHCEFDLNECEAYGPNGICQNGGICLNEFGGFRCECPAGFTGELCETNIDDCVNNVCYEGSTCIDRVLYYDCECKPDRIGIYCENENLCFTNETICNYRGECEPHYLDGNYTCHCEKGFMGKNCEIELDNCYGSPCHHGRCYNTPNWYACECDPGYSGPQCETRLSSCDENPCKNGGKCRLDDSSDEGFDCDCINNFYGEFCEHDAGVYLTMETMVVDDCRKNQTKFCQNRGVCTHPKMDDANSTAIEVYKTLDEEFKCQCLDGFMGDACEIDVNECHSNPCKNSAKCVNMFGDYKCECPMGFGGRNCELNVDECENINCLNGGTCVDGLNSFKCECTRYFIGKYCEISLKINYESEVNKTDECFQNNCTSKAGNAICDAECNFYACDFDGGDCSTKNPKPFNNCSQADFCAKSFANGICDEVCNNEKCLFDGFDCEKTKLPICSKFDFCSQNYANGICDLDCNNMKCGWDGGDCDEENNKTLPKPAPNLPIKDNVLEGELSLILLGDPEDLLKKLAEILIQLSRHLQASVRIMLNSDGKPLIHKWRNDTEIGELIESLPEGIKNNLVFKSSTVLDDNNVYVARMKRDSDEDLYQVGIQVLLKIGVAMCQSMQQNATGQGQYSFSCFSQIESVSAFLTAASSTNVLGDIGKQIFSAEARYNLPEPAPTGSSFFGGVLVICIAGIFVLTTLGAIIKFKSTFIPQMDSKKHGRWEDSNTTSYTNTNTTTYSDDSYGKKNALLNFHNFSRKNSFCVPNDMVNNYPPQHMHNQALIYPNQYSMPDPQTMPNRSPNSSSGVSSGITSPDLHNLDFTVDLIRRLIQGQVFNLNEVKVPEDVLLIMMDQFGINQEINDHKMFKIIYSLQTFYKIDLNIQDKFGNTLLILCIKKERPILLQELLKHFGNQIDPSLVDNEKKTPMHHAVMLCQLDSIRLLWDYYEKAGQSLNLNALDNKMETVLMYCCKTNIKDPEINVFYKIGKFLIDKKADVNSNGEGKDYQYCKNFKRRTALHIAAMHDNVLMIDLLIHRGANMDVFDIEGRTPLFLAAINGKVEALQTLLKAGADPKTKDQTNTELLVLVKQQCYDDVINILENHTMINRSSSLSYISNPIDSTKLAQKRARVAKKEKDSVKTKKQCKDQLPLTNNNQSPRQVLHAAMTNGTSLVGGSGGAKSSTVYTPPHTDTSDQSTYTTPSPRQATMNNCMTANVGTNNGNFNYPQYPPSTTTGLMENPQIHNNFMAFNNASAASLQQLYYNSPQSDCENAYASTMPNTVNQFDSYTGGNQFDAFNPLNNYNMSTYNPYTHHGYYPQNPELIEQQQQRHWLQ